MMKQLGRTILLMATVFFLVVVFGANVMGVLEGFGVLLGGG